MAFSDAEKVDIRRFAGYPAYGAGASGFQGWRFFHAYGLMEFRLNNMAPAEEAVIRNTYLANLYLLETDIVGTRANLDTKQAAVFFTNPKEQRDREALFASWRRKLAAFMGVPVGPSFDSGGMATRPVI